MVWFVRNAVRSNGLDVLASGTGWDIRYHLIRDSIRTYILELPGEYLPNMALEGSRRLVGVSSRTVVCTNCR